MKKETLIKLLVLCNVSDECIRYCTHLGVTVEEVERYKFLTFAENDGRMEL